ncbi:MAG: transposase [Thermoguttaceae bacterium]|jgi:hypothetical protein
MAHGRRNFEEAIPATSHPLVHEAMIWTQQLYDIEDRAKEMSVDARRALRQAEALPILARMKARFEEVRPTLRPTSKLAEAIDYVLNRWAAFVRYTEDGRIPVDNNVIERLLRPVAIGRNYAKFRIMLSSPFAATYSRGISGIGCSHNQSPSRNRISGLVAAKPPWAEPPPEMLRSKYVLMYRAGSVSMCNQITDEVLQNGPLGVLTDSPSDARTPEQIL